MSHECMFTFTRWTKQGPEEISEEAPSESFDEAMVWAGEMCKRNKCLIKHVEWYDKDLQRWQQSDVSYT